MSKGKKLHLSQIDGLRAFALMGILLYHLVPEVFPGGFLGVLLFFVLSGYFITRGLLHEWDKQEKINLRQFYKRRFNRLLPSVLFMLFLSSSIVVFLDPGLLAHFRGVVLSSLFQVNNWWQISSGGSYFAQFGTPSLYSHLWFVSILGQLYLVFPILFGVTIHFLKRSKKMYALLSSIIFSSALLMLILFYTNDNLNRVYYGTDTRLFSFFIGVVLAYFLNDLEKKKRKLTKKSQHLLFLLSFSGMLLFFLTLYDYQPFTYTGGMLLFSFLSGALLWSVLDQQGWLKPVLSNRLFRYLSKRSYQIYLWQFPIITAYDHFFSTQEPYSIFHLFFKLVLIILFSEISYTLIEKGNMDWLSFSKWTLLFSKKHKIFRIVLPILMGTTIYALIVSPSGTDPFEQELERELQENQEILSESGRNNGENEAMEHPFEEELLAKGYSQTQIEQAQSMDTIAVGDSMLVNIGPELQKVFTNAVIDADIGRQLYDSEETFISLHTRYPDIREIIIILGSNGTFRENDLESILTPFDNETTFYFVNTTVPRSWRESVNNTLAAAAEKNSQIVLIDWHEYAVPYMDEWFYEDGVHTNQSGSEALTNLIAETILAENE